MSSSSTSLSTATGTSTRRHTRAAWCRRQGRPQRAALIRRDAGFSSSIVLFIFFIFVIFIVFVILLLLVVRRLIIVVQLPRPRGLTEHARKVALGKRLIELKDRKVGTCFIRKSEV